MSVYAVDKLMAQTRKLAAEFRQTTGQPLPVTADFDAAHLLELENIQPPLGGCDVVGLKSPPEVCVTKSSAGRSLSPVFITAPAWCGVVKRARLISRRFGKTIPVPNQP